MDEKRTEPDLLRRKFEPITDWKPSGGTSGDSSGPRGLLEETLERLEKSREALAKKLEPLGEEAKIKFKDSMKVVEEVTSKSAVEARSYLAKALLSLAERIKPK